MPRFNYKYSNIALLVIHFTPLLFVSCKYRYTRNGICDTPWWTQNSVVYYRSVVIMAFRGLYLTTYSVNKKQMQFFFFLLPNPENVWERIEKQCLSHSYQLYCTPGRLKFGGRVKNFWYSWYCIELSS